MEWDQFWHDKRNQEKKDQVGYKPDVARNNRENRIPTISS